MYRDLKPANILLDEHGSYYHDDHDDGDDHDDDDYGDEIDVGYDISHLFHVNLFLRPGVFFSYVFSAM